MLIVLLASVSKIGMNSLEDVGCGGMDSSSDGHDKLQGKYNQVVRGGHHVHSPEREGVIEVCRQRPVYGSQAHSKKAQ